jgi:uncharacterized OsmC-like protein
MQDQATKTPINGVPVDKLMDTMQAIREEPKIAKFSFRAKNRWHGGGHNRAEVNGYHGACNEHARNEPFQFDMDEPPILLSGDKGANPVEYVLAALSGCLTTSLIYHAAARGIEITDVESSYEGDIDLHGLLDMDEAIRNGYEQIRVNFKVKGDASEEELDELVRIAQQRSPVYDIVTNGVPVKVERAK